MERILVVLFLCGCSHAQVDVGAGSAHGGVQAHVEGGRGLALLFGFSILAAGIVESQRAGPAVESRTAPELDATRKVSEQDCTKPLDYSLGNIRCK